MKQWKFKKILSLLLVLVMAVGLLPTVSWAAGGKAKVLTVDKTGKYPTIQSAVNAVAAKAKPENWTIQVSDGEYDRFTVDSPVSGLTIEGESRDGVVVKVLSNDSRFAAYDNGGINIWAPNVTLKNLTVRAGNSKQSWSDAAISTNHTYRGGAGNSLTVENCTVTGAGMDQGASYGIFWNCDRVEVENCSISGFPNAIEFMLDNFSIPSGHTYHIKNNMITDCSFAVHGYLGGNDGSGTLEISNNVVTGSDALRAKVIVQENATQSFTANIHDNTLENAVVGTLNLRQDGDKNDVLADNSMGKGCFFVDAIEPGTIEFYTTYQAPEESFGHWELCNPEGLEQLAFVRKAIAEANRAGSRTLSISGLPDGALVKTFTWFKDAIYWVSDPKPADPVEPTLPQDPEWEVSRSKTATNLNEKYISDITLSLPSAEQNLKTDIVFVFDESSCRKPVIARVSDMLEQLYRQEEATGAAIQIGAVQFRGEATEFPLKEISSATKDELAAFMQRRPATGGSNLSMGLLAGEKILDGDTTVDAERKHLILVSDGIAYIWDDESTEERENLGVNFSGGDSPDHPFLAGPDGWDVRYGRGYVPEDWSEHLSQIGAILTDTISRKSSIYDRAADISGNPFVKPEEQWRYASSVDVALFKANEAYRRIAGKYHTYACMAGVEQETAVFPFGPSFMNYLADGKEVTFTDIERDILYLLDEGSAVVDYMGYEKDSYNFDFISDGLYLTVGDQRYEAVMLQENVYGFKPVEYVCRAVTMKNDRRVSEATDQEYAFVLTYVPGGKAEDEHFVWEIREPVSNFAPVQLHYCVKLMNPHTEPGKYGVYDKDGSHGEEGLYTNCKATLYPVDSTGTEGESTDFAKPTVSYEIPDPVKPMEPDKPEKPEKPVEPDKPEKPEKPVEPEKPAKQPQTGDQSCMTLWTVLSLLSLGGTAAIFIAVRRRKHHAG